MKELIQLTAQVIGSPVSGLTPSRDGISRLLEPETNVMRPITLDPAARAQQEQLQAQVRNQLRFDPLPGMTLLGCGYDVFGVYADSSGVKECLLNTGPSKLNLLMHEGVQYAAWEYVQMIPCAVDQFVQMQAVGARRFWERLGAFAGLDTGWEAFSGSFEPLLESAVKSSFHSFFTRTYELLVNYDLHLTQADLERHLSPKARKALESEPPQEVIRRFGTHVLCGMRMGGRLDLWAATDPSAYKSTADIEQAAKAAFGLWCHGFEIEDHQLGLEFIRGSQIHAEALGGDPLRGEKTITNQRSYQGWKATVKAHPSFVEFTKSHSLIPIWKLTEKADRAIELRDAANRLAKGRR